MRPLSPLLNMIWTLWADKT